MAMRSASDGQVPDRLKEPRSEAEEAEYFLTEFSNRECLGRIRGCYVESQLRAFASMANELDVQDNQIFEAISEQLEEAHA